MASRKWYPPALVFAVVVIGAGAAFSIPPVFGWHVWGPLAKRPAVATPRVVAKPPRPAPPQQTAVQPSTNSGEVTEAPRVAVVTPIR